MPDLDTLLNRLADRGLSRPRAQALQARLEDEMWRIEVTNLKMSALGLVLALAGLTALGGIGWLVTYVIHQGITNFGDFASRAYWLSYLALVLTAAIAVSIIRPRSMYGMGRGPYTISDDPMFWRDGEIGEWENLARLALALPNLLRMSLYNLLCLGHLRRIRGNGDLALYTLLAADKRIVAEEIIQIHKKKRPADLWSVVAALSRLEYLRCERLGREMIIWRGRAADRALGITSEG